MSETSVVASICCMTYNQAPFIEQTLESFLAQKTSFSFEILVHDDASTDGTRQILERYEKEYPHIIKVFYEEQNQWNTGKYQGSYTEALLVPAARGDYIALCEGDDYWTDCDKLQKQVDYLQAHPECVEVCHAAFVFEAETGRSLGVMGMGPDETDLTVAEIVREWSIPTASRVRRKDLYADYAKGWTFARPVGDFPTAVHAATKGAVHYFPQVMCAYRYATPGSWTAGSAQMRTRIVRASQWIAMLDSIDSLTGGCFHAELLEAAQGHAWMLLKSGNGCKLGHGLGDDARRSLSVKQRVKLGIHRILWAVGLSVEHGGISRERRIVRHG